MHSHTLERTGLTFVVDYNSWQESPEGIKLASSLSKDVVLAEGKLHQTVYLYHHLNHLTRS